MLVQQNVSRYRNLNYDNKVGIDSKGIPEEVKLSIKALADDTRLSIVMLLLENDRMAFSQLKQTLNLSSSSLSNHLTLLQDGGIVNNFLELKNNKYSYYTMTEMGTNLIKSIYNIIGFGPTMTSSKLSTLRGTASGSTTNIKYLTGWSKSVHIVDEVINRGDAAMPVDKGQSEIVDQNVVNRNIIQEFYGPRSTSRRKLLNEQRLSNLPAPVMASWI